VSRPRSRPLALASLLLLGASCYLGSPSSSTSPDGGGVDVDGGGVGPLPFSPVPANVYVAKVKNLLVGLPPSDSELQAVTADPSQLGALVDGWMKMPEYQTKMLRFFELAFQQSQVTVKDFGYMTFPAQIDSNASTQALMLENMQESFARTVFANATATPEVPFNQAFSTHTIALTTALKAYYAFQDVFQVGNQVGCGLGAGNDAFKAANPNLKIYVTASSIPLSQTLDPQSANYMHWTDADVAKCPTDPIVFSATGPQLYALLFGTLNYGQCPKNPAVSGPLQAKDFQDWTMTTLVQGAPSTPFYDLATLRSTNKLTLSLPHVGFLTPAFFANWMTNASNQMRVTMNQAFIVATGAQVDGTDPTIPSSMPGLDSTHATDPACVGCHQLLDPSRSILAATYSWDLGKQPTASYANQPGLFAFHGVEKPMSTLDDLGKTFETFDQLAPQPLVASGWAEKLCFYFNSTTPLNPNQQGGCVAGDPVFDAIVKGFQANYSWNQLVKAVVVSPLTTYASSTLTATTNGEVVAVSRRDHLCAAWNARLGFDDICNLDPSIPAVLSKNGLATIHGLPSDGYARGAVAPVLPNAPTLFYRGGLENLCEELAQDLIDDTKPPKKNNFWNRSYATWSSTSPDQAISDFVEIVMGLPPSDPRASGLEQILTNDFTTNKATAGATAALQSTFVVACLSPSALGIGM